MVFESLVAGLLNSFLGDYVQNFDSSKLKLGLWGGDVSLKHLDIKESALDDLDLPVKVVSGHLGQLILKIPYKNMYTAPVTATIEGLYVLVTPNLGIKYNADKENAAAEAAKQAELQRIEEAKRKETAKKDAQDTKPDTFTEKLITQIIKNLQVKITDVHIRYEDNFSDPKNPFSLGFTLHNLAFETTDDKWKPAFVDESVQIIHKLVTLDSLAVYWNSKSELCSLLDIAARQNTMSKIIATSEYKPENVSYLLGPINSTAQLRLNSKPESDGSGYKIPKVWLNVIMEEIVVGLSRLQYQDLVKLLESFDRMTVASLYRKYRPDAPHAGHAKEWWKFAINAILEEDVRRKCRNWSWKHMKYHLSRCKEYKELYVIKLMGKKFTSDVESKICNCEKELDLFNITVVRRQAELEVLRAPKHREAKQSWGGWVSSFFSPTADAEESAGKKIVKQFEEAMTAEEKDKLYEAIGYQEQPTLTEYPKEFVENNLLFLLHNLTLILSDDTKSQTQVLKANLMEVSACVEQRPSAQALSFDAKIDSFVVNGVPIEKSETPTIVTSFQSAKRHLPLLKILFETNPLDGSCDQRLHVNAQPLQITYDAITVNNLADVFKPPEQMSFQQLQATAKMKFDDMKEMSAFGLQYAIEQHKYLDLKIDMQPAYIIIPEKGAFEKNSQLLVISLGNFKMDTMRRDPTSPTVKSLVTAGSTNVEVLSTMIDKAYDKFHIEIQNTEILLVAPDEDWKSAIGVKDDYMHLLKPLTVTVDFHKSIVTVDPRMPKMRLVGELPLLEIGVSDFQLTKLLTHLMSIPLPESDVVSEPERAHEFSPVLATDIVNVKVVNQIKKEAVHTFTSSSESEEETAADGVIQQTTEILLQFEIKKFGFSLSQRINGHDQERLKFSFHHLGIDLVTRTFDMTADVYLRGISLEDLQHKTCKGDVLKIISTAIKESEEYLFSVKYVAADKKGPDFDTIHNSTLQNIAVNFNKINIVLHQESILSIMDFANDLVSNLEAANPVAPDSSDETTKKKSLSETKPVSKGSSTVKRKKKEYQIIDTQINAALESIRLIICNSKSDVTDVRVEGMNASLIMQKSKTSVTASLKDIIVFDPTPNALYSKILSTVAGEVLDLKVTMYDDATDDENYIDMSAVDMSISVGFGRMKVVFLNKFVSSLLYFLDHFQAAKDKVAEAGAVAAEAAKQSMEEVYEKSTRILLDIIIQAPVIIIPQNSKSTNTIVADLGISKISNRFELGGRRNELGMPAIFERMTLDLQNLQLLRAIINPKEVALESESLVLEPVSFTLQVTRNHSSGWLRDVPEMEVEGKLATIKITLSNEDYSTVMSLLSENLTEVIEGELPSLPQVTPATADISKKASSSHATVKTTTAANVKHISQKIVTRFKFDFVLDCVKVTLCSSEKDEKDDQIPKITPMAEVQIRTFKTRARIMSDSSMTAKVVLVDFILDDTRSIRKKGITRLMERSVKEGADSMICVEFQQSTEGEMKLQTTVSSFYLVFCLDYITKLGEFFAGTETPTPVTEQAIASKPSITPVTSVSSDSLSSTMNTTVINLKVNKPDIVLIENIEDLDSNAIFLHTKIDLVITLYGNSQVISGTIKNLTFYTACFNPESRDGTMSKILVPCDIDVLCNFREFSQHMDIIFKDLVFRISPETVQILSNILSSVLSGPSEDQEKKVKDIVLDYTDLWERKSLNNTEFWFLHTVEGTEAIEEIVETGSISPEPGMQPIHQQMLVTMRKIVITIEAGVGNRTVPMLLMESSFQSDIRDWSGNMYIGSSFSLEISYYNEKLSVWEPLMEPVETKNGHRSWELMMEIFQENEILELTPEDEEPEEIVFEPPQMSIQIAAQDVLELTFSKTCLDVLTNLGEAFQEAISTKASDKLSQPSAPYHVNNFLGLPITIILSNQAFQILNDNNKYNSVKLESGCPPLHLVYSTPDTHTSTRLSILKKQDVKDDTFFNIKIIENDMNVERRISVSCTDKRFFQLPRVTYPGNRWGFVITVLSLYGTKFVTFHSIVQIKNNFSVPIDVYYMKDSLNEVEWCACVEPSKSEFIPLHAVYTSTSELFFKPKNLPPSYTLSLPPFVWKDLIDDPSIQKVLHCKDKLSVDWPFYFSVAGEAERIFYEDTNRKTMASSIYKVILNPTAVLRNLLLYPINYSVQGIDKDHLLKEGESHELWGVDLGKSAVEIRLNNYLDRSWVCHRVVKPDFDELSVWIFEAATAEHKFYLELGMHTVKSKGSIVMELYSPFCMVNKTGMNLTYRGEDDNIIHHPPTLNKPVLFSFKAKVFFAKKKASLKIADSEWSDKFSLDAVGSSGTLLAKTKQGQAYCIGVEIKLSQAGLTKIVIFTPYYFVVNNCEYDIEIMEAVEGVDWFKIPHRVQQELTEESTEKELAINCVPFWPKDANNAKMVVRYCDDKEESSVFSFKEIHSTLLPLDTKMGGIHVDCQVTEASVIITFEDYKSGQAAALLVNETKWFTIKFHQSHCFKEVELEPKSYILYSWENPLEKKMLLWKCEHDLGEHDLIKDGIGELVPKPDIKAYWVSFLDGMQRVLMFTDDLALATAAQEAGELERIEQEITVSLQGVGLSLVNNDVKSEIMYLGITSTGIVWEGRKKKSKRFKALSAKDNDIIENAYQRYQNEIKVHKLSKSSVLLDGKLEIDFESMTMSRPLVRHLRRTFQTGLWLRYKTSPHQLQLHAKINRLQIDNQLTDCVFPVVLAPVAPPKSVAAANAPKPFTELSIMLRKAEHSAVPQFKYCKILIQEFHVRLDQGFINSILVFFTADQPPDVDYVKMLALDQKIAMSTLKDLAAIYSSQEQTNFFDDLHFSPLKIHISFSMTGGSQDDSKPTPIRSDFVNLLLQSVGVTLTEIQDVVFKLDYFERKYVFMSQKQLIAEVTSHYVGQSVKQLYMLVLGLDVIGNPVGLLLGIGEGVTDLFYEPFQGAIQGPEEFAEGLALGVKSLFGHAIGGAAGAASRITGTLGKGIAALTLDKDYQKRRRQNITRRPVDFTHGIAQSGKGLVMGVFDGVTGIVTKPIEGAREEGVGGFFKGVGKGLIGVVTRPTAGLVDFASGSLDAVKRATQVSEDVKRLRVPRFIKPDGVIRAYVKREAEGNRLLQEVEKGKYANTDTYLVHVPVGDDDRLFLLVTNNRIMYVEKGELFGQWNTVWEYRFEEIKGFPTVTDKGLKIMLQNPQKKSLFGNKVAGKIVHIKDPQLCEWIADKISEVIKRTT